MKTSLFLALTITTLLSPQDNRRIGDFTRSPTEHIIVQLNEAIVIRSVCGVIRRSQGDRGPLPNVLIEIEGPDGAHSIKHTSTNKRGQFRIGHVRTGTYKFKTTLDGFQSVMGTIIVSNKANKEAKILIEVPVGV